MKILLHRREYVYILTGFVLIQIIMYFRIVHIVEKQVTATHMDQQKAMEPVSFFKVDTAFVPHSNLIQISGEAPANTILGLWHNGLFVTSTISQAMHYSFKSEYLYNGENEFVIWAFTNQGRSYKIDSLSLHYFSTYTAMLSRSIEKFQTDQNCLALTFDAGSTANGADTILQILRDKHVNCTVFLTGDFIKSYPEMIKKLDTQGLELANHTFKHPHLTNWEQQHNQTTAEKVDRFFVQQQLLQTDSLFLKITHRPLKPYWRAPYGEVNPSILQWAAEIGYRHIGWIREGDSRDWVTDSQSDLYRSPEQFYKDMMDLEHTGRLRGAILLMHLGTDRKSDFIYPALIKLIDQLQAKNYQFLTISQFLEISAPL